jgi:hypothetical protein
MTAECTEVVQQEQGGCDTIFGHAIRLSLALTSIATVLPAQGTKLGYARPKRGYCRDPFGSDCIPATLIG